jgi:Subtilase family
MRSRRLKRWLVLGAVPVTVAMGAVPAVTAAASSTASSSTAGAQHDYVVFLRDQNSSVRKADRAAAARQEQSPVLAQLHSLGGKTTSTTTSVNAVYATMTSGAAQSLAANPNVALVAPEGTISMATPLTANTDGISTKSGSTAPVAPNTLCGTPSDPQLNPEALYNINDINPPSTADGAGVTVAYLADGIDPSNPDFSRNAAFASTGSPTGSPVVTQEDFSTDGTNAPTDGGEAFLDASSIAAQGNTAYNLNDYDATVHQLNGGAPCDIKIQGAAPGADVLALKVFAQTNDTTVSGFVQAINYAVAHGVKVINESFGSNNYPDLTDDAIRMADNAAVADGVTVVVSTGDAGPTSTIGSPSTDPNVISVGASTTLRAFTQFTFGGINDPAVTPGKYVDNNVSSISSGGASEGNTTVDLVAPGDWNWALCEPNDTLFTDCVTEQDTPASIQFTGGTSEASPLTAGAAADVIQAYAGSHGGTDPSPALVKRILMSSATDIDSPANQQGAGLLNVGAAVALAQTIGKGNEGSGGGVVVSPGQINIAQNPGHSTSKTISVTNTSSSTEHVKLSTRALGKTVGTDSGSFCMQPGTATASCPANTGVFPIWSGVDEVYQNVSFTVPATKGISRLSFSADYPYTGQTSLLHFALIEPDGAYAGYSDPQGLADFGNVQISNPPAGTWTAVFFTEQDGATAGGVGTSGTIQWSAATSEFSRASKITPSSFTLSPGQTGNAVLKVTSPGTAGDTSESVVVASNGARTTVPVTVRTLVPTSRRGGSFKGVLTGGNGRADEPAQVNFYQFNVPHGAKGLDVGVKLANDPEDIVIAQLIAPDGANLGYTTNVTYLKKIEAADAVSTRFADLYHANPEPGRWTLLLEWQQPVSGLELSEPFTGTISFGTPVSSNTLPHGATLKKGKTYTFKVKIHNSGRSPEWYFVDARKDSSETISLPNQNPNVTNESDLTLPLVEPSAGLPFPYYIVPSDTTKVDAHLSGSVPVNFDTEYFPGDPDVEGTQTGDQASAVLTAPQLSPGLWLLNPDEIGPYPATGAPAATASASLKATFAAFDKSVTSKTGDMWSWVNGLTADFTPVYVGPGKTATITVKIKPSAAKGSFERGTLYVDDVALAGLTGLFGLPNGDQLVAIPYSYHIKK